jgi:2-dehydropantoate 2-reductase
MRSTLGPIVQNSETRAFLLEVMREVVAVGRAHGVPLPEDFAQQRLAFCDRLPLEMDSSMHADLDNGKRLEVDWLSGAVVELGKAVNVNAPMNSAVRDILALYAHGKQSAA